ncbi:MAG: RNA-guided pseudouridylation complex pseudouridine synthase subunit Cbf5 [Candidatus Pacearchaeota archaeon]|nr:RNA-guided pseudouridylation complex pseudouridine synthase subunit Cbf5 [Candidatus Pacearchaeota archaeon]
MEIGKEKSFIILDKPKGMTSFEACDTARKKVGAEKAGHAGTLDPNVTGVLLIALNKATKLMPLFERLDKTYEGKAHLHKDISLKEIEQVIKEKFLRKIKQVPPKKSRVARIEREREIYEFKILKKKDKDFWFRVSCQAGTYIRKLIHDVGQELGIGCHMTALRRIKQGPFAIEKSVTLEKLSEKDIIEAEKLIAKVSPIIYIKKESLVRLRQGKFLFAKEIEKIKGKFEKGQVVAAFCNKEVIALVKPFFSSRELEKQEGFALKPERVI